MSWTCKRCKTTNTDDWMGCKKCLGISPYIAQIGIKEKDGSTLLRWKTQGDCEQAKLLYCGLEVEVTHLCEVLIRGKRAKEVTFILENKVAERTYTYNIEGSVPILQILSTKITEEDLKNAWTDEYGVEYSLDGKRLLKGKDLREYKVREGTKCICDDAFRDCTSLTSITLPDSLTSIGAYAFEDCTSLTSITLPDSLTSIGAYAFEDCTSLTSITFSKGLTSIENGAFEDCTSLTSITLPDSLTSIGDYAFWDCTSLTSVTLPDSLTSIGESTFEDCTSLASITLPDSLTSIGAYAFEDCTSLKSITFSKGLTSIEYGAFFRCRSLKSITLPDSLTSIGDYAFWDCTSLTSITLPDSLTSIGESTFENCTSLASITLPDGLTSIGDYAFAGCWSLTNITLSKSLISIGEDAFTRSGINSIVSNSSHFIVEEGALYNETKTELLYYFDKTKVTISDLPDSLTSIGDYAFVDCKSLTVCSINSQIRV